MGSVVFVFVFYFYHLEHIIVSFTEFDSIVICLYCINLTTLDNDEIRGARSVIGQGGRIA